MRLRYKLNTGAVLLAVIAAATTHAAQPSSQLITEEQLSEWDKQFPPGRYAVTEYVLDVHANPVPNTSKTSEACFTQDKIQMVSRLPAMGASLWNCEALQFKLEPTLFGVALQCPAEGKKAPPLMGAIYVARVSENEYRSVMLKTEVRKGRKDRLVYGAGSTFSRLGDCNGK